MKIKKIKLLKALALTGAFGIVATVPIIVSSCSSTGDNNGGSGDNNNGNQGGQDGQQTEKVTPELKSEVSLSGSLDKIYDSSTKDRKTTNQLIADDVKAHPENYFTNGDKTEVKETIKNATVTVDGKFTTEETESPWKDVAYLDESSDANKTDANKSWSATKDLKPVLFPTTSDQIDIKSLDDLHSKLNEAKLKEVFTNAKIANADKTTFTVKNKLGFTNSDLIHVNVEGDNSGTKTQYDLQIPTSDINLSVSDLSIKVEGTNIEAQEKTSTKFDFNIGIDSKENFNQGSTEIAYNTKDLVKVDEVLEKLGFAKKNGSSTELDNDAIIKGLGIYNVNFSGQEIKEKTVTTREQKDTTYTVSLKAKPTSNKYVWADDSTSDEKTISFDVTIKIGTK
ncbi:hypothetical protein D8X55_03805 [Malacoplasma penetrans]|uniref:P35 lipoprotein homolog n=1 Tax=Malacoplasma penetrans (strain HF-2) TaxID=272633 RepID=Q8EVB7_MALP2|nr:P35 family lipoprotein [Malacoplasma penetrans]RXY96434.1 hypothetical protein D8X55_03805 [Malacoplasma penetrans]BAC44439.1 P35 lipoprotein homolog [Malacoplasma penetrans HF-2]